VIALGADPAKFDMIIYGTKPDALRPDPSGVEALRAELGIDPAAAILLCVGRMAPKKGFDYLIRALAEPALRERNVVAVMVGGGDELEAWQRLAGELGVAERLRWAGYVPYDHISLYYNLADVLVMPSVTRPADGLNVCVLDAMSCAKPVVGTEAAGNRLAIVHGETGLIVPEQDVASLAHALARLADDRQIRVAMGRLGRRRIETELGWPHLARRYREHFARLAHGGSQALPTGVEATLERR